MKLYKMMFMLAIGTFFPLYSSFYYGNYYYQQPQYKYLRADLAPKVRQTPPPQNKNHLNKKKVCWSPQLKAWIVRKAKDKK